MSLIVKIEEKGPIPLIGREGYGECARGSVWIQPLWRDLQAHVGEVAQAVKRAPDGRMLGLWGAMSDAGRRFRPWTDDGLYLAGFEADENALTPPGWTRWVLPAFRYATAECTPQTYGAVLQQMLLHELPDRGYDLAGAVQEYYPGDKMVLYVPIAVL